MDSKDEKQVKASRRAYYRANIKKIRERNKVWRKANPEKAREKSRKRRASIHKTIIEAINEKRVFMRDGWICQHCKKKIDKRVKHPNPMSATLDHIIPLSEGGSHTYNNVQLAHFVCNITKQARTLPQGEQLRMF